MPVKHSYKNDGPITITLTGVCDNLYGWNPATTPHGGAKKSKALVHCLYSVKVPKDSESPLKYGYGSFFGCQNLRYLGYGVFHNITECKEVPHLYDGAILKKIEPWMLYGGVNLESVEYTFENCQMETVDKDLFKHCPNITNIDHCFHRCNKLKSIPEGLFDHNPKIQTMVQAFKSCTDLEIVPPTLFDNCLEITNCKECFCGGSYKGDESYAAIMKIKTALPPLWERTNIRIYEAYGRGCTSATNYNEMPNDIWKFGYSS